MSRHRIIFAVLAALALAACSTQHSQAWYSGYYAGKAADQASGGVGDQNSCSVVMDAVLGGYKRSADWQDGFMTGCTGGSP